MSNSEQLEQLAETPQPAALFEQQINQEADREKQSILERAHRTAEEIRNKASQHVQHMLNEALQNARKKADAHRDHLLSRARLSARREQLLIQEKAFLKALAEVQQGLERQRGTEQYKNLLTGLTQEAIATLGVQELTIGVTTRDIEFFQFQCLPDILQWMRTRQMDTHSVTVLTLEEMEPRLARDIIGVLVRSKDGRLEYDNTFSARVRRMDNGLRTIAFEQFLT